MGEREFTLLRLDVRLEEIRPDRGGDGEDADREDGDGDGGGRSTARLAVAAFLAAGVAGAAAVVYALRGRGSDEGEDEDGGDEFDAESDVVAELDAETDRRFHRVRGAFPTRRTDREARPDAGAGMGSLVGFLFALATTAVVRRLAADRDPDAGGPDRAPAAASPTADGGAAGRG